MSAEEDAIGLRFAGQRYEGGRMPVGMLPDLDAFRDLLVAFAKANWFADNASRSRLPNGFEAQLTLDLVEIKPGSAVPLLAPSLRNAHPAFEGMADGRLNLFRRAYADFADIVEKAANDKEYTPILSREQASALKRFGAGLQEGEKIELTKQEGKKAKAVVMTLDSRRELIARVRVGDIKRLMRTGVLKTVSAAGWVEVEVADLGTIKLKVGERCKEFDGFLLDEVCFEARLELDENERFRSVIELYSINLNTPKAAERLAVRARVSARLDDIAALQEGWLDGDGLAVSGVAMTVLRNLLDGAVDWFSSAGIFPTIEGGICIEANVDNVEYSFELGPDGSVSGYSCSSSGEERDFSGLTEVMEVMNAENGELP